MQLGQTLGWVAVIGGALVVLFLACGLWEVAKDPREEALERCECYHELVITWRLLTKNKPKGGELFTRIKPTRGEGATSSKSRERSSRLSLRVPMA